LAFTTAAISVWEKRFNRTFDIPSAFINTDSDENVLMVVKDDLAEMMEKLHQRSTESTSP